MHYEKRRIQRINLDCPLVAHLGTSAVHLLDVSADGARIAHEHPLVSGRQVILEFSYDGQGISALCTVTRCKLQRSASVGVAYCSGLRFDQPKDPSIAALRRMIADYVSRDFEARRQHQAEATV